MRRRIIKWFKHYTRAHEDRAIEKLVRDHGIAGYGLYFYCLEVIAGSVEVDNITFELEPDAAILARRLSMDTMEVEKIMRDCVNMGLFEVAESGRVSCLKIGKFFDQNMTSNPMMRKIFARHKHKTITSESQVNHKSVTTTCDQIRLDEIRLDKKEYKRAVKQPATVFSKPSIEEVKAYCAERKNHVDAERFIDHYESNGWKVGKTPMKSWKAAVRTWEKNNYDGLSEVVPKQAVTGRSDAWTSEDIARQQEAIENRSLPTLEEIEELEAIKKKALGTGPGRLLAAVWGDHEG